MMAGNLSIEQRNWILKQYWKTENAERVRTAWVEAFNTPPLTRLTIDRIRDKFDATGSVANAPKSGRLKLTKCQYPRRTIKTILYTIYCTPTFGPPCIIIAHLKLQSITIIAI
jgi:hypothetical protein